MDIDSAARGLYIVGPVRIAIDGLGCNCQLEPNDEECPQRLPS